MTPQELTVIRIQLGLKPGEMAKALNTPRRTFQEWESGGRRIPGVVLVACEWLKHKDREFMNSVAPGFIPSRLRGGLTTEEEEATT